MASWKFGDVVERRGEKVMFLRAEKRDWGYFIGVRITQGRDTPKQNLPGGVGRYTTAGFRPSAAEGGAAPAIIAARTQLESMTTEEIAEALTKALQSGTSSDP